MQDKGHSDGGLLGVPMGAQDQAFEAGGPKLKLVRAEPS